jgi:hypothetical protein
VNQFASHFDFTMSPHQNSTVPLTMMCPWSHDVSGSAYLAPAPDKPNPANLVAFFNSGSFGALRWFGHLETFKQKFSIKRSDHTPFYLSFISPTHFACTLFTSSDPYYDGWVRWLMTELGDSLHVLNQLPEQVNTAAYRMQLMSQYKFVLVTEQIALEDWVVAEFSQV